MKLLFLLLCFSTAFAESKEITFTLEDRDRLIRIEAKLEEMEKRFEQIDKRFEQIDKRFEQIDKRIDNLVTFMWMLVAIFVGITATTIGFALWDRRTMIRPFEAKTKEIERKITQMDEAKISGILQVLRDLAKEDPKIANALRKFNLL